MDVLGSPHPVSFQITITTRQRCFRVPDRLAQPQQPVWKRTIRRVVTSMVDPAIAR